MPLRQRVQALACLLPLMLKATASAACQRSAPAISQPAAWVHQGAVLASVGLPSWHWWLCDTCQAQAGTSSDNKPCSCSLATMAHVPMLALARGTHALFCTMQAAAAHCTISHRRPCKRRSSSLCCHHSLIARVPGQRACQPHGRAATLQVHTCTARGDQQGSRLRWASCAKNNVPEDHLGVEQRC
jgi:hypothetical protein